MKKNLKMKGTERVVKGYYRLGCVWVVALVICCVTAHGASIDVLHGAVGVQTFDASGVSIHEFRAAFTAQLSSSNAWQIRVNYGTHYVETVSFDGAEFRSASDFSRTELPNKDGNQRNATVTPWSYPIHSEPITRLVWLALAPDTNMVAQGRTLPALWNMPFQNSRSHFLESTNIEWLDQQMGRYSRIDFANALHKTETLRNTRLLSQQVKDSEIAEVLKYIQPGFVEGRFHVALSTNWNGGTYPLSFSLEVFAQKGGKETVLVQQYHGVVERIELADKFDPFPSTTGKVSVRDYRFFDARGKVDSIAYASKNGEWLSETNSELQKIFADCKFRGRKQYDSAANTPGKAERTGLFIAGCAIAAFCILCLPLLWKRKSRETPNNKRTNGEE
jgi:hypothetical protein